MTGSHEVRGSIPLGSTNHFNYLKRMEETGAVRLGQTCDNAVAYTLTTPQSRHAYLDRSRECDALSSQSTRGP